MRIVIGLGPTFDHEARLLAGELEAARLEGEQHFEELVAALPARLRRLFKHCVVARAEDRNPPDRGSIGVSSDPPSPAVEAPTGARAGRPLGLSIRRQQLLAEESAVPAFKRFRVRLGLSQSDIAEASVRQGKPISKSTIGNIELGEVFPRRHHAEAIAAALGQPVDLILDLLRCELEPGHVVEG